MTHRTLLFAAALGLAATARASDAPDDALSFPAKMPDAEPIPAAQAYSGGEIKSLVQRLRAEREAQMGRDRVPALGSLESSAGVGQPQQPHKYLSGAIASSLAEERAAQDTPTKILPGSWVWSGDRDLSLSDAALAPGSRSAQSWRMNIDVPVTHFWGKATLSAGFERSQPGSSTDPEAASAPLTQSAKIALSQDLKHGALSGTAQLALSGNDSRQDALPTPGERDVGTKAEGSARLKLQLAPNLALTGSHQSQLEQTSTLQPTQEPTQAAASAQSNTQLGTDAGSDVLARLKQRQAANRSDSQLGLEWKWSKSLSLSAGASLARSEQEATTPAANASPLAPQWLRDESAANLSLQKRTGGGSWGLQWSRALAQKDAASQSSMQRAEDTRTDNLSLQAEHKLFGWLQMRGSWKLAGDTNYLSAHLSDQATREAEARISGGLGSLALRYSDWSSQSSALGGDLLGGSGRREYGVRYQAGSDKGLGLAVEYSVRAEPASNAASNWKLGVTYR